MLSLTCQTAMKAVIFLGSKFTPRERLKSGNQTNQAKHQNPVNRQSTAESPTRFGIQAIAENLGASQHTVGKLLQTLVKAGVINSVKGPSGGFYITEDQMNTPLIEIIFAIDGKEVFKTCGLGLKKCSSLHPCPIHDEYKKPRDAMEKLFSSKKIIDLCGNVQSGLTHLII